MQLLIFILVVLLCLLSFYFGFSFLISCIVWAYTYDKDFYNMFIVKTYKEILEHLDKGEKFNTFPREKIIENFNNYKKRNEV